MQQLTLMAIQMSNNNYYYLSWKILFNVRNKSKIIV